jgi:hypothetical protein
LQDPLTTPDFDGAPVAHSLGPPPPATVVRKSASPVELLQNPLLP